MLKIAALAALGYGALMFIRRQRSERESRLLPVAGGPLSSDARVQSTPDAPSL